MWVEETLPTLATSHALGGLQTPSCLESLLLGTLLFLCKTQTFIPIGIKRVVDAYFSSPTPILQGNRKSLQEVIFQTFSRKPQFSVVTSRVSFGINYTSPRFLNFGIDEGRKSTPSLVNLILHLTR